MEGRRGEGSGRGRGGRQITREGERITKCRVRYCPNSQ